MNYFEHFTNIQKFILWIPPVLFAIIIHEVSHGWMALFYGDRTAKMMGRLTLNPLKHIDPIGTVIVPILLFLLPTNFIFGWAKPVPVDCRNMRNVRKAMIVVALAGPLSNFLMAVFWALLFKGVLIVSPGESLLTVSIGYMAQVGVFINIILMVINLVPIPPLDGSRVLASLLPPKYANYFAAIEPYGFFVILILLLSGIWSLVLAPIIFGLLHAFVMIFGLSWF